eukprot:GHVO01052319.1.p1 GENE.GHVO01052319.1~~GHVO01052319.1.p1  ORF type:complete len:202 (-),score=46.78 GHVO01052319.1:122-727(-)
MPPPLIRCRCATLRAQTDACDNEYDVTRYRERLAKLNGRVAVIRVGGHTEIEANEAKERINDALNATKAALDGGVIPGGGAALLFASQSLERLHAVTQNTDQATGIRIVQNACKEPCRQIASNAGHEGAVVVGNLLREGAFGDGFDAQSGSVVDMYEHGILDPTLVVKTAIKDAASIAGLMITTEAVIAEASVERGDQTTD